MTTAPPRRALALVFGLLAATCTPRGAPSDRLERVPPANPRLADIFEPAALDRGPPPPSLPGVPLTILDSGPRGRSGGGEIYVRFNRPVAPLDLDVDASVPLRLDPPVPGKTRWKAPDRLVFTPDAPLALAQTYTVSFHDAASDLAPVTWQFETERPQVAEGAVIDDDNDDPERGISRAAPVLLTFSQPVDLAALRPHVHASARQLTDDDDEAKPSGPPRPLAFDLRPLTPALIKRHDLTHLGLDPDLTFLVTPRDRWPADAQITLEVRPGLRGRGGPLPSDTPWALDLRTHRRQAITKATCGGPDLCPLDTVTVHLRNQIRGRDISTITVSPRPRHSQIRLDDAWQDDDYGQQIALHGAFLPGRTYTVTVPAGLRDRHGQALQEPLSHRFTIDHQPTLEILPDRGTFQPGDPKIAGVRARHLSALELRAALLDEADYAERLRRGPGDPLHAQWPARPLEERHQALPLAPRGATEYAEREFDLTALFGRRHGVALLEVRATERTDRANPAHDLPLQRVILQLSDLGPLALTSLPRSLIQLVRTGTQEPVPGALVLLYDGAPTPRQLGRTDPQGILQLPALDAWPGADPMQGGERAVLVARDPTSEDRAFLALNKLSDPAPTAPLRRGEHLRAQLLSERDAYRPGEALKLVGWTAIDTPYEPSGLRPLTGRPTVELSLIDAHGDKIAARSVRATAEGKFSASLTIPAGARLGRLTARAELWGAVTERRVKLEDFRAPEFQVDAHLRRSELIAGERAQAHINATYYFGAPVPVHDVDARTTCRVARFRPPGLDPRWTVGAPQKASASVVGPRTHVPGAPSGALDLEIGLPLRQHESPQRCEISLLLRDASLQAIGADLSLLVHPAAYYLALALPRRPVAGQPLAIPLRALAPDGARVAARDIQVQIKRRPPNSKREFTLTTTCTLNPGLSGDDPTCALPAAEEGTYQIEARGADGPRQALTTATFTVQPKPQGLHAAGQPRPALTVELTPTELLPGDPVTVTVTSPWPLAAGHLLLERAGIRERRPLLLEDGRAALQLATDDTWVPGVTIEAVALKKDSRRPSLVRAEAHLKVSAERRHLEVAVKLAHEAGPGQEIPVHVEVRDHSGAPLAARLALWAVDEAVLSLTDYKIPDLVDAFTVRRGPAVLRYDDFSSLRAAFSALGSDPWFDRTYFLSLGGTGSGYGAGGRGASGGASGPPPPARARFETTPFFLGDLPVGPDGRATRTIRLPDDLTTFRVTAIASAPLEGRDSPGRFGVGDAQIRVTKPLVLRAALPRVLRPGDTAELAAIVQSREQAGGALTIEATLHAPGRPPLRLTSPALIRHDLPAGAQFRAPFTVHAEAPGDAEIELRAVLAGGAHSDAVRLPLRVIVERTLSERVATYGALGDDQPIAIPLRIPKHTLPGYGGVQISATTTLLGGLEDAVHDLLHYPHGCLEQTASRLLPLVALHDLAQIYPLPQPERAPMIRAGVDRLLAMQLPGGGFAYWPGDDQPHHYASAYAAWVLHLAQKSGIEVPAAALERAFTYLEGQLASQPEGPHDPGAEHEIRRVIALHTLSEAGRRHPGALAPLYLIRARLPVFARAFLLLALHSHDPADPRVQGLTDELLGQIVETPAAAHVHEPYPYDLGAYFHSDGRSDAILLLALLRLRPDHPRVQGLARGLLERRVGGAWRNTQENAYALLAVAAYARYHEATTPDLSVHAWVGAAPLLDAQFRGAGALPRRGALPLALLRAAASPPGGAADTAPIILHREGDGLLYYRIGAEWSPLAADLPARAQGLAVARTLRRRSGPSTNDLTFEPGEPLALDLEIHADTRARDVALEIPLPGGLEAIQRELGRGQRALGLGGGRGAWVTYEEQHSDRILLYADDLAPGPHRHTLYLRATTPGVYQLPPAHIEAMYTPELYGRSAAARLQITSPTP